MTCLIFDFRSGRSSISSEGGTVHGYEIAEVAQDGHVTFACWLDLLSSSVPSGVLGAIAGIAAWLVWRFVPSKAK